MSSAPGDRERWTGRYEQDLGLERAPSTWVLEACARIPPHSLVIDIAAGSGRHARPIAEMGHDVTAIDFVELAVREAARTHARVHGVVADVWSMPLRRHAADAVVCANFLERELFPELTALVKEGGLLIYETYTLDHRLLVEAGRARAPRSPNYLLAPGELPRLVAPLEVLDSREGHVTDAAGERYCASVVAVKR